MTYPQQPYGGGQPDPYGQAQGQPGQYGGYQQPGQPGGQYSGQYPGYGGQQPYGGYDQTAQFGGFPGGQYGGGYGAPPPPPKKNTGMIVAVVAIVVLLLGGLGVTGFVAPGFFVSDDKNNAGSGGGTKTSSSAPSEPDTGADEIVEKLVTAADQQDATTLKALACSSAESNVQQAIDDIGEISGAEMTGTEEVSDAEVMVKLDIDVNDGTEEYEATVVKDGEDWCWNDIVRTGGDIPSSGAAPAEPSDPVPPTGSGPTGSEGETFVQEFLDTVNGGDGAGAKAMLCDDSTSQADIDNAIKGKASLQMDTAGMESQAEYVGVDLTGTLNGAPSSAARTSAFLEEGGWCVFTFYVF
ncbi:MAG TPA: hypothetical protein VNP92_28430 [Actinophytocola sp.]|nr:hypothetical protein [Actinophytocola sp.]